MDVSINLSQLDAVINKLQAAQQAVNQEVYSTMTASLSLFENAVVGLTPVNFGTLRASVYSQINGEAPHLAGEVGTPLVYGVVVEQGRTPGARMPPVGAIELWAVRKLGLPAGTAETAQAALNIARAIGHHGTKGVHMFETAFKQELPTVLKLWDGCGARIAARLP